MRRSSSSLMKSHNKPLRLLRVWSGVSLLERTVGLKIEKAYAELKALLLGKGCRITTEEAPALIAVKQGSLWGISPRTAKKKVICRLAPADSGTRITCSSSLASDWKNLTVIGTALAMLVTALCWWIATDLDSSVTTQHSSYWSWLVTVDDGYVDFQAAQMLAGVTRMLAIFLAFIIIAEAAVAVYAHFKTNVFVEEALSGLR
jgi:hypothetical protein